MTIALCVAVYHSGGLHIFNLNSYNRTLHAEYHSHLVCYVIIIKRRRHVLQHVIVIGDVIVKLSDVTAHWCHWWRQWAVWRHTAGWWRHRWLTSGLTQVCVGNDHWKWRGYRQWCGTLATDFGCLSYQLSVLCLLNGDSSGCFFTSHKLA